MDINTKIGTEIFDLIKNLYPIHRSITGEGIRQTLDIIKKYIPLQINEIPTGTKVFDWEIPKEWNINDAYVKNTKGKKIIDLKKSNLHILGYSVPIRKKVSLAELKKHLFTIPDKPDWIPYRTSYYKENWGFCITQNQFDSLEEGDYEVFIDSSLNKGSLAYGELLIKGEIEEEILMSTYICHPSLCNDNLSGAALCTYLAKQILITKPRYSYRFLFIPETIGSITWLSKNESLVSKIKHGLVVTCVGDKGDITYKRSKIGNAIIDKAVEKVLIDSETLYKILDFSPIGSDERQYCSPGFNLPIGSLMRTPYHQFPEYHTSKDNINLISIESLQDMYEKYLCVFEILEQNRTYISNKPRCEPMLEKIGMFRNNESNNVSNTIWVAIFWILAYGDGTNSLLDVAFRSCMKFDEISNASKLLLKSDLIKTFDI